MLTLDALARMADGMPSESRGDSAWPPYRVSDPRLRTRDVRLPTVADEARRAVLHFAFFVSAAVATLAPVGVLVTHALDLYAGQVAAGEVARTALWFGSAVLLLVVPLAGIGLARELARFRRVRALLGHAVTVHAAGFIRSEDGSSVYRFTAGDRG